MAPCINPMYHMVDWLNCYSTVLYIPVVHQIIEPTTFLALHSVQYVMCITGLYSPACNKGTVLVQYTVRCYYLNSTVVHTTVYGIFSWGKLFTVLSCWRKEVSEPMVKWLARLPRKREVVGSNPGMRIFFPPFLNFTQGISLCPAYLWFVLCLCGRYNKGGW